LFVVFQQSWQEICLLLSDNPESGCSESIIINRPITKSINKSLAKIMLEGSSGSGVGSFSPDFMDSVVRAFGTEAAVYMGGPDMQEEPAMLIHGIANLPGSIEVAPGTGIYRGGWEGAVDGVLQGDYKPLDFRFFLGRQIYDPARNPQRGVLLQKVRDGKYQPVACARSLALKQCLGLPKPLWHEGKMML
jgi:putative transcriptional regulator